MVAFGSSCPLQPYCLQSILSQLPGPRGSAARVLPAPSGVEEEEAADVAARLLGAGADSPEVLPERMGNVSLMLPMAAASPWLCGMPLLANSAAVPRIFCGSLSLDSHSSLRFSLILAAASTYRSACSMV